MTTENPRLASVRRLMADHGLDGLVCRLSQNVLMLSGYWPINGLSFVVVPRDGAPALVLPEQDERWCDRSWVSDRRYFRWGQTDAMDPFPAIVDALKAVCSEHRLAGKRLGIEIDSPLAALPAWSPEVRTCGPAILARVQDAFADAQFVESWPLLHEAMSIKTADEITKIRLANRVAALGIEWFQHASLEGMRECEVGAAAEHAVNAQGPGIDGARLVRAWAHVMSGPNGQYACQTYNISTTRRLTANDLTSLEIGVVVDGYWSDLTRMRAVGTPLPRQTEVYELVLAAQDAAVSRMQPGTPWSEVDRAARETIRLGGYGDCFPHISGHGTGFCYHETVPLIGPTLAGVVTPGQIVALEPAIYHPEIGGVRHEDNYLITDTGVENLSPFSRALRPV